MKLEFFSIKNNNLKTENIFILNSLNMKKINKKLKIENIINNTCGNLERILVFK